MIFYKETGFTIYADIGVIFKCTSLSKLLRKSSKARIVVVRTSCMSPSKFLGWGPTSFFW